ncbi:class I SAM-dependent RNA methyltransferase [Arenibaculum sp.]|jgi:23S rRNA (uracil1939-C5)-methyltransferase|uniref:class I SAM-dependent RNA methyltransferase n=1 Tax=Arenibaculum sp. TaxID=2865862 RepID=UPI002E0F2656|nr:class I SAM-dependent RNA methyltransferase [Arenibaculum sp.]
MRRQGRGQGQRQGQGQGQGQGRSASPHGTPHGGKRQVELTVERIGGRGDGLATLDGRPVFVPQTVPGDRVRVRVEGERAGGLAAEVLELIEPGPERVEAPCGLFGRCGGCALQHLDDTSYARLKRGQVATALSRAGLGDVPVGEVLRTAPATRRRATFAAKRAGGRVVLGFNERQSAWIVDVADCLVVAPAILAVLEPLRAVLDAVLADGPPLDVSVTALDGGLDVLVTGGAEPGLAAREAWAAFADAADLGRLSWRAQERSPVEPLAHRRPLAARFGAVAVPVPPGVFLQPSAEGEAALVAAALAALEGCGHVVDLFAGAGTFTFPLALASRVHAVEGDEAAFGALAAAARGVPAVSAQRRDLFRDPLTAAELHRFDGLLFDPPRAGAAAQAAEIAGSRVPVVVGVSCNPGTFARDARTLVDGGYALEAVTPVDQFLWSSHVELVAVFRK